MNSDAAHQAVLDALFQMKQRDFVKDIWLIARLKSNSWLKSLDPNETLVFIPDLHLVSKSQEDGFSYSFNKVTRTRHVHRKRLLEQLASKLLKLKTDFASESRTLRLYQLGDFIDFWRQGNFDLLSKTTVKQLTNPVLEEYAALVGMLTRRRRGLNAQFIDGNHDPYLGELDELNAQPGWFAYNQATGAPCALITHGYEFDPFERAVPEVLKLQAVRAFGANTEANTYPVPTNAPLLAGSTPPTVVVQGGTPQVTVNINYALARLDAQGKLTDAAAEELKAVHELLPDATRTVLALRKGSTKTQRTFQLPKRQASVELVVVGHSHHPRAVAVTSDPGGPLFVLLDCGAWIENIKLGGQSMPSCQLGVACGNDVRIYQIQPGSATLAPALPDS